MKYWYLFEKISHKMKTYDSYILPSYNIEFIFVSFALKSFLSFKPLNNLHSVREEFVITLMSNGISGRPETTTSRPPPPYLKVLKIEAVSAKRGTLLICVWPHENKIKIYIFVESRRKYFMIFGKNSEIY